MPAKPISESYAVGAQIAPGDMARLAALGYASVICNRPDSEVGADAASPAMAGAAARHALAFYYNPISPHGLTQENLDVQAAAIESATGPVFAYCRSGRRSTICWSFVMAPSRPTPEIIASAAAAGYRIDALAPHLDALRQG